jgi:hypothetical protein
VTSRRPGPQLAEHEHVDVVVHPGRSVVALGEVLADGVVGPARHDRRRDDAPAAELDRAGHTDANTPHRLTVVALGEHVVEELADGPEHALRPGRHLNVLTPVSQQGAREVSKRDVDSRGAQVGRQHTPGVRAEAHVARGTATGRGAKVAGGHETELLQVGDPLRHQRPAQAGTRHDLGPRGLPVTPDVVEHGHEGEQVTVVRAHPRGRARLPSTP